MTEARARPRRANAERLNQSISAIWDSHRHTILAQVGVLEDAAQDLRLGHLRSELRDRAEREAHKLAGSVGTFGFARASDIARELEVIFDIQQPNLDVEAIAALVGELRAELEVRSLGQPPPVPPTAQEGPLVLIVEEDADVAKAIAYQAEKRGFQTEMASHPDEARDIIALFRPEVALVGLRSGVARSDTLRLLNDLADQEPRVPTLVAMSPEGLKDRVEVARLGTRGFLQKPFRPAEAVDAIVRLLERSQSAQTTVLVVDDDAAVLDAVRDVLETQGMRVSTLNDPTAFWETLTEVVPDLLVVDLEMPDVSGIELCRVIRNDPRWVDLPVLFLTAVKSANAVQDIFAAGADDYIQKPVVGPELITRIANRLERVRLYKALSETDPLTSVANRRRSVQGTEQLIQLADRYRQPLSVAVLDLDHFKTVNDIQGHAAGDEVLRALGETLRNTFRGEDIVSRWGGEEFFISMYGMEREDGVERVAGLLEDFRGKEFKGRGGTFSVAFTGGIATYPQDGSDLHDLYRVADAALYRAKEAGRDRVLQAGSSAGAVRALVFEEDAGLAQLLVRAFETRSYSAHRVGSVSEAKTWLERARLVPDPFVVLMGWERVDENVVEVIRYLRDKGLLDNARTILMGARATEMTVIEVDSLQIFDVVPKPLSVVDLMKTVRRALG